MHIAAQCCCMHLLRMCVVHVFIESCRISYGLHMSSVGFRSIVDMPCRFCVHYCGLLPKGLIISDRFRTVRLRMVECRFHVGLPKVTKQLWQVPPWCLFFFVFRGMVSIVFGSWAQDALTFMRSPPVYHFQDRSA